MVSFVTAADRTDLFICQCKTLLAVTHIIPGACHSTSQLIHLFFRHIDNEDLAIQKQALTQKQKELAVLLDENKDYEEMEQAYQQWSGTEKEPMGQNRFHM